MARCSFILLALCFSRGSSGLLLLPLSVKAAAAAAANPVVVAAVVIADVRSRVGAVYL